MKKRNVAQYLRRGDGSGYNQAEGRTGHPEVALFDVMSQRGGVASNKIRRGLTPKQAKFVRLKAQGLPNVHAAMQAYDTTDYKTASAIAGENLTKPRIRELIAKAFDDKGVTVERAIEPIIEALGDNDLDMRLKGSDRALKLMGAHDQPQQNNGPTFNFNFGDKTYIKNS